MDIIKKNDYEIKVIQYVTKETADVHSIKTLKDRKTFLIEQKDLSITDWDAQIAHINNLLKEAKRLGVLEK